MVVEVDIGPRTVVVAIEAPDELHAADKPPASAKDIADISILANRALGLVSIVRCFDPRPKTFMRTAFLSGHSANCGTVPLA